MSEEKTYILGISAFYHDAAAVLIRDGQIIAAAQEERFTRVKHDPSFPEKAIEYCLAEAGIAKDNIDMVAFYDKPFLKFERLLETYVACAPSGVRSFISAVPGWIKNRLFMKEQISRSMDYDGLVIFPEHHHSHAASAFYPSPFNEAAVLTVDGVGEWTTVSFGKGEGNKIVLQEEIKFPHSLGLLYSAFTYYCGFKVNSGEYKLMGLAPYGEPKYVDVILENLIDLKEDGSFRLDQKYFNYCAGFTMTNGKFGKLFGSPRRRPESKLEQRHMDLARSVQVVTEMAMLNIAKYVHARTGSDNLCLAGGVALNCVANGKILTEGLFKNVWIQPAASDAGGALGAALAGWYEYLGNDRSADGSGDQQKASLLGPSFSDDEIEKYLNENKIPFEKLTSESVSESVSDLLADQKVIGWFQGRMEFGPRALGSRSILGDPRSKEMQSILNRKIKFRESFRPFAPSVILEKTSECFNLKGESPYMLIVAPINEKQRESVPKESELAGLTKLSVKRSRIPAVTHVDYSARVQTVKREDNPVFYDMIKKFNDDHGCPVVINTSFNVRGEPIVCTQEEAYKCFMRTNMDFLIMGSYLVDKAEQRAAYSA